VFRVPTPREEALRRELPERVPWDELCPEFIEAWGYPGGRFHPEHVAIVGPTGSGKSWLERTILMERARRRGSHMVVICTKPADSTLTGMGWPIVTEWPPKRGWRTRDRMDQVIFWAKAPGLSEGAVAEQRQAVSRLLDDLWRPDANMVVAFDEQSYLEHELGLRSVITTYYREGRSSGLTLVANTQRPAMVTRYFQSEPTYRFVFAPTDEDDAKRAAQTLGNQTYFSRVLPLLDRGKHEFILVNQRTRKCVISSVTSAPVKKAPENAQESGGEGRPTRPPV
jgi:hypothetical protein